ncbi:MAG: FAD-dependent oxidoreductase [Actinomycetota bacterium]|uniref:FAD-dependent oxidoreductase n=1 Tax=Mycobacterium lentiflavum TaxID=141349 RepID=A0ABY3ULS1_MYCLN|nr:FAD-dependent oxidoreductase [Mycobacterium lentiflavum]MEE3066326.1 FAD-dependent oxidoreductase [Actinomycetota bacterium]ULP40554.1 FAD-dependent oxidoreductase [Mycobacterium lentiflavum]
MGSTMHRVDSPNRLGEHAVVLGAGMAGLLAARVLSEFYDSVSMVERDRLPDYPCHRRGIPQGRHAHNFYSRGLQVLGELFPGLLDDLARAGAVVVDDGDLSHFYVRLGRYQLKSAGTFADPAALTLHMASRPFMEFQLRRRVKALANVTFLDGHDVSELLTTGDIVNGVRIIRRYNGLLTTLDADLVVDAMGRAARTPAFLERLGFERPTEHRMAARYSYASQQLSMPTGSITQRLVMFNPGDDRPGGLLLANEHDTWMLAIGQPAETGEPPTDYDAMLALAAPFLPADLVEGLRRAHPIGEAVTYQHTAAVWRRYDQMSRFPSGLVVLGDALCAPDPTYGQGMTIAALQALTLRDCLLAGDAALAHRYFGATARYIGEMWAANRARSRVTSPVRDRSSRRARLQGWVTRAALNAAAHDVVLTERFFRVSHFIDPPSRLHDPALLPRIVWGNLRARVSRTPSPPEPSSRAGTAIDRTKTAATR